jgi:hypothetical protein
MRGNVSTKIARLGAHLLTHPHYVRRYMQQSLLTHKTPLDLELPWFSYAAIEFLNSFLKPHMKVAEYGSGGSTLFFARRVKFVYAVEDNREWYDRVVRRLGELWIKNVEVTFCPFDFRDPVGFEKSDYLHALPEEPQDVISIDSSEEWIHVRPTCFRFAEKRIKPGGIIILDDSWRYPEPRQRNRAKRVQTFQSVGPCRPGVTTTDVFFY